MVDSGDGIGIDDDYLDDTFEKSEAAVLANPQPVGKLPAAPAEESKDDSNAELDFYNDLEQTSTEHQPFERSGPFSYQEEQT